MKIHTVSHSEGVEVINALRDKGNSKKKLQKKGAVIHDMG